MAITDGPVDPESPLFVGRGAELNTLNAWLSETGCVGAVMGARQTGKTSLLLKLRHTLRQKYSFAFVDLQAVEGADIQECFRYIAAEAWEQLTVDSTPGSSLPGNGQDFLGSLRSLSGESKGVRSILILDELGALPPETAMRLASTIRALFTNRLVRPEYRKYVVLLAGATDMLELTTGRNSPLRNVTESIYLSDLTLAETEQLMHNVLDEARIQAAPDIVRSLHGWTSGHPYWTQLLAGALQAPGELTEGRLASIVEGLLPTEDKNLPHLFRLLNDDQGLWNVVELLLDGGSLAFARANPLIAKLELIGLVKNENGGCVIRNRIYREALQRQRPRPKPFSPRDVARLNQLLAGAGERKSLFRLAVEELHPLLRSRSVALFLLSADRQRSSMVASAGALPTAAAFMNFSAGSEFTSALNASFDPGAVNLSEDHHRQFRELDCAAVVPLRKWDSPIGFFTLGRRVTDQDYDQLDLEFVSAVAQQIAACLKSLELQELERDAERAREIQESLLPTRETIPQIAGVGIAARWQPARIVGGDYYDVLKFSDRKMAITIADVVGKGMPAALMMANLHAAVRSRATEATSPKSLCGELNHVMANTVALGKFITFFYGLIDVDERRITYTNAGHNPPILMRANGEVEFLHVGGGVLAVSADWGYDQEAAELHPNDRILLYTDGATEIWDSDGRELGENGLVDLLLQTRQLTVQDAQEALLKGVAAFANGSFADDVTLVVVDLPLR